VLRNIEFCQLQSKLSDSLQFFLPLVWQQLKDGEIIIREYDRGDPGELSYACTVNLDLERAGRVRVNLAYQSGQVQVTCAAENRSFRNCSCRNRTRWRGSSARPASGSVTHNLHEPK
jgi:hypothetical protein